MAILAPALTSPERAGATSRRVRITYLIGSLSTGGAEKQLLELIRRLDRSRWESSLILFDLSYADRAPGVVGQVLSLDIPSEGYSRSYRKALMAAGAVRKLTGHLRRLRPDILHAFLPVSCILAVPAARLAGIPVLIGSRRSMVDMYRKRDLLARVDRLAARMCDYMLGNSLAVTEELVRLDGVPTERVGTIYNGVDTAKFKPGDRTQRHVYGWTEDHIVFGIVANFHSYKRHVDFVRAAAVIGTNAPHARFIMAGEDRGMLPLVRKEIAQAGLESRFVIIPGAPEPEKLYPAMDAYICTSDTEGFSNVLLEAAASGLPLIATQVGGNAEVVFPGDNGFLIPVATPEDVAHAALTLADDPILRRRMGNRSRELVEQRFSLETMVRQHELLYERALESRRRPLLTGRSEHEFAQRRSDPARLDEYSIR